MIESVEFPTVKIKPRCGKRAKMGHPWIFSNEIDHPKPRLEPGLLVKAVDDGGNFIGYASYNPHSLISLRLFSRDPGDPPGSAAWFAGKIARAIELRERLYPGRRSCRLVYGDSDNLPGLVVDRYEFILAVQILTAGMERLIQPLVDALKEACSPGAIVLRNRNEKRKLEDLPLYNKTIWGEAPEICEFDEFGVRLAADVQSGQKTGHFFDQAENRLALAGLVKGKEVLDLFCHTGAWSMHMLQAGAVRATAVDSSRPAIESARRNAALNGVEDRFEPIVEDAFHWLAEGRKYGGKFDAAVVDPPAFAKSANQLNKALRGYEDLNRQVIHMIRDGGILCACSCSYFVHPDQFLNALHNAAARERRQIYILEIRGQSRDHPILLPMPESRYLKCVIGVVRDR
ncbi:MAG: class I SAM-dependent rRNA methyltransferase [Candidatus Hinthialibacter sp.]